VRSHHFNAANEGLTNTLWTDPKAQASFIDLWVQLSARLIHHPVSQVAYEIMNEPVADDHEDWNKLIAASLKVLRAKEPQRVIVLGANRWQIPPSMPFLKVPEGDKNIILSVHSYSPFVFTHYTADWTPLKSYRGTVQYPGLPMPKADYDKVMALKNRELSDLVGNAGEPWNKARIAQEFAPAIKRARELGLQLYCGEWGCLPSVPRKDRLAYYRDFVDAIEENQMAWANWEYKGDFGIFEWHHASLRSGAPDVEMIEALLGKR
jgi:endoglucanase